MKSKMNLMLVTTAADVSRTQLSAVYEGCCYSSRPKGRVWGRLLLPAGMYSSITNKMQSYTIVFITINARHVSGGSSAHHQELETVTSGKFVFALLDC